MNYSVWCWDEILFKGIHVHVNHFIVCSRSMQIGIQIQYMKFVLTPNKKNVRTKIAFKFLWYMKSIINASNDALRYEYVVYYNLNWWEGDTKVQISSFSLILQSCQFEISWALLIYYDSEEFQIFIIFFLLWIHNCFRDLFYSSSFLERVKIYVHVWSTCSPSKKYSE